MTMSPQEAGTDPKWSYLPISLWNKQRTVYKMAIVQQRTGDAA